MGGTIWVVILMVSIVTNDVMGFLGDPPGPCDPCFELFDEGKLEECGLSLDPSNPCGNGLGLFQLNCIPLPPQYVQMYLDTIALEKCEGEVKFNVPDCKISLMFMVAASNTVGNNTFENQFKPFIKAVLNHDILEPLISDGNVDVGIMSFSDNVQVALSLLDDDDNTDTAVDELQFDGDITNTHKVIDKFSEQLTNLNNERRKVGVLLTVGDSVDFLVTLLKMKHLYQNHPKVKVIVVNILTYNSCNTGEVFAIATGEGDQNLIQQKGLEAAPNLDSEVDNLVNMILIEDDVPIPCSQLLVQDDTDELCPEHEGVYEKTGVCDGRAIYIHTNGEYWIASLKVLPVGPRFWVVVDEEPSPDCNLQGVPISFAPDQLNVPLGLWPGPVASMDVTCYV